MNTFELDLELHVKRTKIEKLEQEQEALRPTIEEAQRLRKAEQKLLATGRRRAQRLLALADKEGLSWVPGKGTAHRKGVTTILALALRPQDESVWDTPEFGGEDAFDVKLAAIVLPGSYTAPVERRYEEAERKIKRLRREVKKLESQS